MCRGGLNVRVHCRAPEGIVGGAHPQAQGCTLSSLLSSDRRRGERARSRAEVSASCKPSMRRRLAAVVLSALTCRKGRAVRMYDFD